MSKVNTNQKFEGLKGLAHREAMGGLSEKPLAILSPWEKRGITEEEFLKETSTTLYRAVLSITNADPAYLKDNFNRVLQEMSKIVESSGYFLIRREGDKVEAIVSALHQQIERVRHHESQSVDPTRISSSSED